MATLRDLGLQPFQTAPADVRPAAAPPGRWVVLTDDDSTPISAIAPGTLLEDRARPPCIIVASADLGQAQAYGSAAFEEYTEAVALVLIEGSGDIAGVVSGDALRRALVLGPRRGWSASVLPGPPTIPWISRSCGYTEADVSCGTTMSFAVRPAVMPGCGNQRNLAAHEFRW
jgi:hypothetical protein